MTAKQTPEVNTSADVLITAFDAFGHLDVNPSASLLSRLAAVYPRSRMAVLPTSFDGAWRCLQELMLASRPSRILMFGYARGVAGLRLEARARNADNPGLTDNDGRKGRRVIWSSYEASLASNLPVQTLTVRLQGLGIPATSSSDAGGFVCNNAYFKALATMRATDPTADCLFAHVGDWQSASDSEAIVFGASALVRWVAES